MIMPSSCTLTCTRNILNSKKILVVGGSREEGKNNRKEVIPTIIHILCRLAKSSFHTRSFPLLWTVTHTPTSYDVGRALMIRVCHQKYESQLELLPHSNNVRDWLTTFSIQSQTRFLFLMAQKISITTTQHFFSILVGVLASRPQS
jgi:hypothetical protein